MVGGDHFRSLVTAFHLSRGKITYSVMSFQSLDSVNTRRASRFEIIKNTANKEIELLLMTVLDAAVSSTVTLFWLDSGNFK